MPGMYRAMGGGMCGRKELGTLDQGSRQEALKWLMQAHGAFIGRDISTTYGAFYIQI